MKLQDVMSRTVATCRPEESLHRAAQLMWEGDFGCVVVVDAEDRPVGVLTDRDLCMAAWSQDKPLREIMAGTTMGQPVVTVSEGSTTAELHERLREHQLHRMPIVDANGRLVGIVSHSNLILGGSHAATAAKRTAAAKELLDTLSQIKTPRSAATEEAKAGKATVAAKAKTATATAEAAAATASGSTAAPKAAATKSTAKTTPATTTKAPAAKAAAPKKAAAKNKAATKRPAKKAATKKVAKKATKKAAKKTAKKAAKKTTAKKTTAKKAATKKTAAKKKSAAKKRASRR